MWSLKRANGHRDCFFTLWLLAAASLLQVPVLQAIAEDAVLLEGSAPPAIEAEHFPSRVHTFVWRNWESVELSRMAEVLDTTPENVARLGESMGLPPHQGISKLKKQRGYVSLIRRNWHLLPYDQLMVLLDWDADRLAHVLKEEDFLWFKLGMLKPKCEPLRYAPPTPDQQQRARVIKHIVENSFGDGAFTSPMEPRYAFIEYLSEPLPESQIVVRSDDEPIRFLYSYFALYGDPLDDPSLDPYPEGLLQRLAASGVNGVWMHTILRDLAPSKEFPEFGRGHEARLANLRRLVERCGKYGIKIYLYMNEPRSMPDAFFEKYPDIAGHPDTIQGHTALCTSTPKVRRFMRESLAHVFREVPGLGGAFNITMVENLTNCYSRAHGKPPNCERCARRAPEDVIAEVNRTIAEGVHAGDPNANVLIWDWVWKYEWAEQIITSLPNDVYLMSVSEWDLPINRGGTDTVAGEYSMSAVGPGPRATRNWGIAQEHGLKTIAKIQMSCTWELSVVPYIPVMDLVAEHLENLSRTDVSGYMLSWTLGGYPSPNLELLKHYDDSTPPDREKLLASLAEKRFGPEAGPQAREAWRTFSKAFREYPFYIVSLYNSPVQVGPANPLFPVNTEYRATMVGYPYDDLTHWRSVYPVDTFASQFEKVAEGWQVGLDHMRQAVESASTEEHRTNAVEDLRIAEAAYTHFKSVANQTWFTDSRNLLAQGSLDPEQRKQHINRIVKAATSEIELAKRLFVLTREDSRIGFEATNHYMYYPLDLVEKVINCRYVLDEWLPAQKKVK